MTFCSNCGADVEDNQKFCPECGTRLQAEQTSVSPPRSPPPGEDVKTTPPPPPPAGSQSDIPPPRQGILGRVDIDQEDIDEVAEKAKKGLGAAWRLARKGLSKGAELASQGIEVAKDTIEERREQQQADQAPQPYQAPPSAPAPEGTRFCPNCGQPAPPGKFCNNCGQKLE